MKNRSFFTLKYVILAVLFMVTAVITFFSIDYQRSNASTIEMSEAKLPIVAMQTLSGQKYNELHGYTASVDELKLERSVTPLGNDKKLPIIIDTYGENITGISYKVRGASDLSLIENTQVSDYSASDKIVTAELNIKNLIENNTIYYLQIIVSTDKYEEISYYTSIIGGAGFDVDSKLDFALHFSSNTLDSSNISSIAKYLETKASADNSNYGKVNINCKQSVISWGDLHPFVEGEVIPEIKDISSEGAQIELKYVIGAENEYSSYDTYYVNEWYKLGVSSKKELYLVDYKREANQLFDSRNDFSGSKINLGIHSDSKVDIMTSTNGNYIYFINQGVLWCYSVNNNMFTQVFSFASIDSDNVRENYANYNIKIMNVLDNGDCDFLVSGYMNRGEHEGKTGVEQFFYNYKENTTNERVFIPLDIPHNAMTDSVGAIAYVNENGIFYITIENTLYAINLTNNEVMVEISNLNEGAYAVSKNGRSIAYSKNNSINDSDAIRIFNMEKGTDYEIHAEDGCKVKVIGFINSDFIYGIANVSDIQKNADGTLLFPMGRIEIIDDEYNEIKQYDEPGIYISDASVENLRLNLTRMKKNAEGQFESTSSDQLINREENTSSSQVAVDVITTQNRLKEVVLQLQQKVVSASTAMMRYSDEISFIKNQNFHLNQ